MRQAGDLRRDVLAVAAMHHAIQVVAPIRQTAFAAIAERHARFGGEQRTYLFHITIGDVKHHHGVCAVAEFMVPHDDAEALDQAFIAPVCQPFQHPLFGLPEATRQLGIRLFAD